ncbi:MAG: SLOG family protein [Oscillospiraceae bacterium]|nr:SLOG family protein [Oscillospiraceae bacterium]
MKPFSVCISGHRPEKLPEGAPLRMMLSLLYREIEDAIADGASAFYVGMSLGIDLWAADIILYFRRQHPNIRLICAMPYPEFNHHLQGSTRYHFQSVLHAADAVIQVCPHYHPGAFRMRNQYMVDHCRRIIAVAEDSHSGTGQTIRMAKQAGMEMRIISLQRAQQQSVPAHTYFQFLERSRSCIICTATKT